MLRQQISAKRRDDPLDEARLRSRYANVLAAAHGHDVVATYASLPDEPDTLELVRELHGNGVRILLPLLNSRRTPTWGVFDGELTPGFRGIPEPTGPSLGADALAQAGFVLTSALAVNLAGVRLGTGGGWWDRALVHANPDAVVATLVNDDEIVVDLPVDAWDVPVGLIISEERIIPVGSRNKDAPTAG